MNQLYYGDNLDILRGEAASAGFYTSGLAHTEFPRLQLLTVEELLNGVQVKMPAWNVDKTFRRARVLVANLTKLGQSSMLPMTPTHHRNARTVPIFPSKLVG